MKGGGGGGDGRSRSGLLPSTRFMGHLAMGIGLKDSYGRGWRGRR